jgi:hypothetical protein
MTTFLDKSFSQKIERAEAKTNADFVETRILIQPETNAGWIEVGGAYAMFDGVQSPLTQTFGLGLFNEITDLEMDEIESFFKQFDAPVYHEVSPLADASILELLNQRDYQPFELTNILYKNLAAENSPILPKNPNISTRIINRNETDIFAETSVAGWSVEMPEFAEFGLEFCKIGALCKGANPFIAELNGEPIATGSLMIYDDLAMLGGASTIAEGRNKGAQTALLAARLNYATEKDCKFAIMGASPGSQSQRNAEKKGFRVAYTRTKWRLK